MNTQIACTASTHFPFARNIISIQMLEVDSIAKEMSDTPFLVVARSQIVVARNIGLPARRQSRNIRQ